MVAVKFKSILKKLNKEFHAKTRKLRVIFSSLQYFIYGKKDMLSHPWQGLGESKKILRTCLWRGTSVGVAALLFCHMSSAILFSTEKG